MALSTVHIRKEAFLILAWAAIETFKKECYGFFLGYLPNAENNFYSITDAIPLQKVERHYDEIRQHPRAEKRLKKFLSDINIIYPKHLGFFHSHTEWGKEPPIVDLSNLDKEELIKSGLDLVIIITIASRRKGHKMAWEVLPNGSVKGAFDKYILQFNVYTMVQKNADEIVPQQLRIVTPHSIETLNRIWVKK